VVEAALRAARLSAEEKRIEIAARLAASADAVSGDSERLQQVVNNLLSNAIKFTPEGGRITVKLVNLGSWLELSVADTGKGIRRDFLPFVFEPFRQAETHAAKAYGGLGLGLAIVRQLVQAHGGTVTAESDGEGLGATFRVRLPVCVLTPDASSADGAQSDDGAEPLLAGRKILVVDDDPDACELVREVLLRAGAQAVVAKSADEALMAFRRSTPDAILSDIGMPYFDGYQLIAKIRSFSVADGGGVPAIALTALGGEGVATNILGAGFQAHIPKPVEPHLLIRLINELLPPEAKREW
jgi:CheY-like chemotaxis protein